MLNNRIRYITTHVLIVTLSFFGCAGSMFGGKSSNRYIHTYTMIQPASNDQLLFKDEYITVQFKIDESAIKFQLQNVSDVPISIVWESVSIGLNNRVFPVKNTSTLYRTDQSLPVPVVIPSLGYVRDIVIPQENISLEKNEWVERDLFPSDDLGSFARKRLIQRYVGSQVKLLLPLKISEVVQEYSFVFKVKSIAAVPPGMLPPVKERPKPPETTAIAAQSQSLLPILIAGGILAVAIYALSKEKADPVNF